MYALHWAEISPRLLKSRWLDFPHTALLVSKRWNAIARDTPPLWNTVAVLADWDPSGYLQGVWGQKLKDFKAYSRGLPLHLDVCLADGPSSSFFRDVKVDPDASSRCQRLRIFSRNSWRSGFSALAYSSGDGNAPLTQECGLVDVELVNIEDCREHFYLGETERLISVLQLCPHLRRLSLKDHQLLPFENEYLHHLFGFDKVHFTQLAEVRLEGVNPVVVRLLFELDMSTLETLGIDCSGPLVRRTDPTSLAQYALGTGRFHSPRFPSLHHLILYSWPLVVQV